jgi:adenine-specific DNA-methyltransferase
MRFIGSKERSTSAITQVIAGRFGPGSTVGDLFCGTAKVSGSLKQKGYRVIANDTLYFCTVMARAMLLISEEPEFHGVQSLLARSNNALFKSRYDDVLAYLNSVAPEKGFMYRNYSPEGTKGTEYERSYFTGENAGKIDAVRSQIEEWHRRGAINDGEQWLLIRDLLNAAMAVSNTAGTYGYFLRHLEARALKNLVLKRSRIVPGRTDHLVFNEDANELVQELELDVAYLDPPYNWRQYAAYYHLLETIARYDSPPVLGKSGLRPWEKQRSRYSIRSDAHNALTELVHRIRAKSILLSYNSDGILTHGQIMAILGAVGPTSFQKVVVPRYTSVSGGSSNLSVEEYLYYVSLESRT